MTVIDAPVAKLSSGPGPFEDAGCRQSELLAELFQLADLVRPWAIRSAAALGVADHLTAGPKSVEDLAATPDHICLIARVSHPLDPAPPVPEPVIRP